MNLIKKLLYNIIFFIFKYQYQSTLKPLNLLLIISNEFTSLIKYEYMWLRNKNTFLII